MTTPKPLASSHDTHYVIVGKIGATHGIKGYLKIHSYTEEPQNITQYHPWYLSNSDSQKKEAIEIESFQHHGKQVLVKLAGLNTPEEARLYTGKTISIKRSQMVELNDDEYYWSDLIGLTVRHQSGHIMGKVMYLIATGANDALVVENEKQETFAIPFLLKRTILAVNLEKKEILVDWEPV